MPKATDFRKIAMFSASMMCRNWSMMPTLIF